MSADKIWYPTTYRKGDEKDIVNFMITDIELRGSKAIFNLDFWNWKYKNNSAGFFPNWILLARKTENDHIKGHYTAIPVKILGNRNAILAAQSVDILTGVDFRKQGIFIRLAELSHLEIESNKVDIIYCYPNERSYPGLIKKLGWKHIFTVEELGYVLNTKKIARLKFSSPLKVFIANYALKSLKALRKIKVIQPLSKKYNARGINIKDIPADIVNKWIGSNYQYYVERSQEYLSWRYVENPIDKNYIVKGFFKETLLCGFYIIKFKHYPHRNNTTLSHIMEFIFDPAMNELAQVMIGDIINESGKNGADLIHTYSHSEQHDYQLYKRTGFIKFDHKNYILRVNNPDRYPEIYQPSKWFITLGDSDRA